MSDFTAIAADRNFGDFPDEFQQHTFGPIDAAALNNVFLPLFLVDREVDIEKISCRCTTAGSAHAITFYKAASGTALSGGTAMGSGVADDLTANTAFEIDTLASNTNLAAGTLVGVGGASGLASLDDLMVTIRTRTKRPRVSDGSKDIWNG